MFKTILAGVVSALTIWIVFAIGMLLIPVKIEWDGILLTMYIISSFVSTIIILYLYNNNFTRQVTRANAAEKELSTAKTIIETRGTVLENKDKRIERLQDRITELQREVREQDDSSKGKNT